MSLRKPELGYYAETELGYFDFAKGSLATLSLRKAERELGYYVFAETKLGYFVFAETRLDYFVFADFVWSAEHTRAVALMI